MSRIDCMLRRIALAAAAMALTLPATHAQVPGRDARIPGGGGVSGREGTTPAITRSQVEDVEARVAAAAAIVNRFTGEAKAHGLTGNWRQATLEMLLPLSVEGLQQVAREAFSLDSLAAAIREAADDPGALGDPNRDLLYQPMTPCRFIDTRNVGGKIAGVRAFDVDNVGSTYGGSGACDPVELLGIAGRNTDQIAALAMNVTLVDTSTAGTPGFVAVKPTAAAPTTSMLNWYQQGSAVQIANQGVVSLDQSGTPASLDEFVIQTSGAVHIVVDLFGAFIRPPATPLETVNSSEFVVVPHLAAGNLETPVCPAGYILTGGGCETNHVSHVLSLSYPGGGDNRWACRSHNTSGGDSYLYAQAVCSRVPGR